MSNNYYDLCCKFKGRFVRTHDQKGKVYIGKITDVDDENVYLKGVEPRGNLGGKGYGFFNPFFFTPFFCSTY